MSAINTVGAFTLLGLWTLGPPIAIQQDGNGKLQISVGASTGEYVAVSRSCSGDLISSEKTPAHTAAAMAEYRNGGLRLSGFGGLISAAGPFEGGDGAFGGGMIAYEGGAVGVGAGVTSLPSGFFAPAPETLPSLYLRVGGQNAVHVQYDFAAPSPFFGTTGLSRLGVGVPIGASRVLLGLGAWRPLEAQRGETEQSGPFAELDIAAGKKWRLLLSGSLFPGERDDEWAVGAGFSFRPR